jgi:Uma2 family endonuclease
MASPVLDPTPRTVGDLLRRLGDVLRRLGDVPADRVRFQPPPGTATEQDVLDIQAHEDIACELVDGTLVEKPMGLLESFLALEIAGCIRDYLKQHDLGITAGEAGMMRLTGGQVRIPDVSFVGWNQLPGRVVPRTPIPDLYPDLAVEVLSSSNTPAEMRRKRHEYFAAGTRLVWQIDPTSRIATVYTAPETFTEVGTAGTLDGGAVLPGFTLSLAALFDRVADA